MGVLFSLLETRPRTWTTFTACDVTPASDPVEEGTPLPNPKIRTHKSQRNFIYKSRSGRRFHTCKTTCKKQRPCSGEKSLCSGALRAEVHGHSDHRAGWPPLHQAGVWVGADSDHRGLLRWGQQPAVLFWSSLSWSRVQFTVPIQLLR